MKLETQRKIWEGLLYFLLLLACILLIVNYILFRSDSGRCVTNTKEFLIEHFEELTGGNITCTCITDAKRDYSSTKQGYKITFSSYGYGEEFTGDFYPNMSVGS